MSHIVKLNEVDGVWVCSVTAYPRFRLMDTVRLPPEYITGIGDTPIDAIRDAELKAALFAGEVFVP